jgi:deoxyribodipyrimidine photo-lyase
MEHFITNKLVQYSSLRNDPNAGAQSELSPYLNHGNLSPQRLVLEVLKANMPEGIADDFLEESIIRREVAENYCLYCEQYDRFEWAWKWAQETLLEHWNDEREWVYSLSQFEGAQTHDSLWNAAQKELVVRGKLHGFMRMYWAKKILEWTESPRLAVEIALYLNDTYAIDGCDPNGYTGIMWSICGIHDRPWFDRPVYGKIRYMNRSGCEKKFNVVQYIQKWNALL